MAEKSEQEIDHRIVRNIPRLAKYGVLTVRPGYEITGHQLVHNKGFVVDGKTVIVSSQNFSPAGID